MPKAKKARAKKASRNAVKRQEKRKSTNPLTANAGAQATPNAAKKDEPANVDGSRGTALKGGNADVTSATDARHFRNRTLRMISLGLTLLGLALLLVKLAPHVVSLSQVVSGSAVVVLVIGGLFGLYVKRMTEKRLVLIITNFLFSLERWKTIFFAVVAIAAVAPAVSLRAVHVDCGRSGGKFFKRIDGQQIEVSCGETLTVPVSDFWWKMPLEIRRSVRDTGYCERPSWYWPSTRSLKEVYADDVPRSLTVKPTSTFPGLPLRATDKSDFAKRKFWFDLQPVSSVETAATRSFAIARNGVQLVRCGDDHEGTEKTPYRMRVPDDVDQGFFEMQIFREIPDGGSEACASHTLSLDDAFLTSMDGGTIVGKDVTACFQQ